MHVADRLNIPQRSTHGLHPVAEAATRPTCAPRVVVLPLLDRDPNSASGSVGRPDLTYPAGAPLGPAYLRHY